MKRSSSIFMGFLLVLTLILGTGSVSFAEGSTTLYLSDSTPSIGEKVTVSVSGSESSTITVRYSAAVLSFESCNVAGYTSDGNSVIFSGSSGDITFTASASGKADVIVSSDSLSGSSAAINVSGDAAGEATTETDDASDDTADAASDAAAAPASTPSENGDFNIDGVDYVISERYSDDEVPAGFDRATLEIHGKTYSEPVNDRMTLLYLKPASDTSGSGVFYIYDDKADSVERLYILGSNDHYVIRLTGDASAFSVLTETTVAVDDVDVPVYQLSESTNDFYYLYGIDENMEEEWYTYRESSGEVARADTYALFLTTKSAEAETTDEGADTTDDEKGSFLSGFSFDNIRNIVVVAVIIIAVIIIFIINLYVFRRGDDDDDIWAEPEDDEAEDDDVEEDEDEEEDEEDTDDEESEVPEPVKQEKSPTAAQTAFATAEASSGKAEEKQAAELPTEEAILKNAMADFMDDSTDQPAQEPKKAVSAIDSLPKKKPSSDDDEITMIDLNNL